MLRGALKHRAVHLNHITWLSEKLKPILWSFSRNKKLYVSKEAIEFLSETKTTENQCWMHRKHIGHMTSQSAKITFAQSERRIFHSIFHPFF